MFRKTLTAFAATAALALGAAGAFTPALANYDYCTENPSAVHCPGNFDVKNEPFYSAPQGHKASEHQTRHMTHHRG